jgi:hypothetical protein
MGNKKGSLTELEIAARQANCRKSTGPRTAPGKKRTRLNALKHGVYTQAQSFYASMVELGEDPKGFLHLLRSLIAARQPADAVEMMLIEDIAVLEWKKARLDRAESGKQAESLAALLADRRHKAVEVGRDTRNVSQAEVLRDGLRRVLNSTAKFEELLTDLNIVLRWVKERNPSAEGEQMLLAIYGDEPSLRGVQIFDMFHQLIQPAAPSVASEAAWKDLEMLINTEIRDVMEEYQLYLEEHVQVSRAQRDAALAPTPNEWHVIIRQEKAFNKQIEQKLQLLESIQERLKKLNTKHLVMRWGRPTAARAFARDVFDKTKRETY